MDQQRRGRDGHAGRDRRLADRSDVLAVEPDSTVRVPNPSTAAAVTTGTVEPNLSLVHAPDMWGQGFRGQHLVVASMDTGVDVSHPDLAGSWRGGASSWFDPNGETSVQRRPTSTVTAPRRWA